MEAISPTLGIDIRVNPNLNLYGNLATLLDTPISWLTWRAAEYWESGDIPEPQASGTGGYRAFKCSDGKWVNVAINMGRLFERGAKVLGLEHLVNDERFNTDRARTKNQKLISQYFSK